MKIQKKYSLLALLALVFAGMAGLIWLTRPGIGTSPDSLVYIGVARNLAEGEGLTTPFGDAPGVTPPMTHRAPFYSILIAGSGLINVDPLVGARWLNVLLFGANILLVGMLGYSLTKGAFWAPLAAGFLMVTSLAMLTIHAHAWSEPVFVLLGLSGLFLTARYLENSRFSLLILAAILIGLANFTRYAGLPFVAAGALALLLFDGSKWARRVVKTAVFAFLSILPLVLWFYRNSQVGSTATSREIAFHPIGRSHLVQAIDTFSGWLLVPSNFPGLVKAGAILLVVGLFLLIAFLAQRRPAGQKTTFLPEVLWLFIAVYLSFLAVSISFFDFNTPLDDRILSPVFMAGVLLAVYYAQAALDLVNHRRAVVVGLTAVTLLFCAVYFYNAARWINGSSQGLGFANVTWQNTEIGAAIAQLPPDTPIFSNAPAVVYILTERPASPLPRKVKDTTQQVNDAYETEMTAVRDYVVTRQGVIVLFSGLGAGVAETEQELRRQLPLQVQKTTKEGTIYEYAADQ